MKHFTNTFSIGFYCRPSRTSSKGGCPIQMGINWKILSKVTLSTGSLCVGISKKEFVPLEGLEPAGMLHHFSGAVADHHFIDERFFAVLSLVLFLRRCDKSLIEIFLDEVDRAAAEAAAHHA